jgi:hypothetical protein
LLVEGGTVVNLVFLHGTMHVTFYWHFSEHPSSKIAVPKKYLHGWKFKMNYKKCLLLLNLAIKQDILLPKAKECYKTKKEVHVTFC